MNWHHLLPFRLIKMFPPVIIAGQQYYADSANRM